MFECQNIIIILHNFGQKQVDTWCFLKLLFSLKAMNVAHYLFQVMSILHKRSSDIQTVLVDTPGQIEVFTWSASGSIVTEALVSN